MVGKNKTEQREVDKKRKAYRGKGKKCKTNQKIIKRK